MKTKKQRSSRKQSKASLPQKHKQPLVEHLHELKRRIIYVVAAIAAGSISAYAIEHKLINIMLAPSHGQNFIYTSPLGGMNFLFSVCLYIGLIIATPIIIYQLLNFLQPLMHGTTHRFVLAYATAAFIVAICGIVFGYYIGLPSALHFLLHQFTSVQIRPLLTVQSYMSFVGMYLFGSALMFQLPLILVIINRIKPLKPSSLIKYERHLIVFAFIAAFIMNPTPNIVDQMLIVVPIIVMYQFGIGLIWFINRRNKIDLIKTLRTKDAERQTSRASQPAQLLLNSAAPVAIEAPATTFKTTIVPPKTVPVVAATAGKPTMDVMPPVKAVSPAQQVQGRSKEYANSFSTVRRQTYRTFGSILVQ